MRIPEKQAVFVFSGLADNAAFRDAVVVLEGRQVGFCEYADHHPYSPRDVADIQAAAEAAGAATLLTTAKDFVRLPQPVDVGMDLWVADAELIFNGDEFQNFLRRRLVELMRAGQQ